MTSRRRILFYSRSPMNTVMMRPIVRRLAADPRLRLYFSGKPSMPEEPLESIFAPLAERASGVRDSPSPVPDPRSPIKGLLPHWQVRWRAFDMFLSPDVVMPARRARHRVEIFHGVSFKGKAYGERVLKFDHLFLAGEYMRRRFEEKGVLAPGDPRAHRIGMPKTDPLVDGSLDAASLLESLGLDPARPTVLYAPTWRPESSLNTEGEAIIDALAGMNLNVLAKIHDHCRDPRTNRRDWGAWLDAREGGNVRRVRDPDVVPALHAAALLVTDASSVANEFTLLDRPILFMDVPELLEVYAGTADLDTWGRRIGEVVQGAAALPRAVERALGDPTAQSAVRRAAADDVFYNPGRATHAAVEAILRILEL
jgi:hypothetical protein